MTETAPRHSPEQNHGLLELKPQPVQNMDQPIRQPTNDHIQLSTTTPENANNSNSTQAESISNDALHTNEMNVNQNNTNDTICLSSDQAFEIMIQYANTDSWRIAFERVMGNDGDGVGVEAATTDDSGTDGTAETPSGNAADQESVTNSAGITRTNTSNILIEDIEMDI